MALINRGGGEGGGTLNGRGVPSENGGSNPGGNYAVNRTY